MTEFGIGSNLNLSNFYCKLDTTIKQITTVLLNYRCKLSILTKCLIFSRRFRKVKFNDLGFSQRFHFLILRLGLLFENNVQQ